MTYGYRLNLEDVFYRMAEENYAKAISLMGHCANGLGGDGQITSFRGPNTSESQAAAVLAVIGWAAAFESFVNFIWNAEVSSSIRSKAVRDMAIKRMETIEKALELRSLAGSKDKNPNWRQGLKKLIELRNRYIHYKDPIYHYGFEFSPQICHDLSEESLNQLRESVRGAFFNLAKLYPQTHVGFLEGEYILSYDEA